MNSSIGSNLIAPHVLLIGDSCIDRYISGPVNRISPEAPVGVLSFNESTEKDGMASNVLANLEALNLSIDPYLSPNQSVKTRYIDSRSNQQLLRVDDDRINSPIKTRTMDLSSYDAIVISDYNKGFVDDLSIIDVIFRFKGPIFIDTKKKNMSKFEAPHVYLKINSKEAEEANTLSTNTIITRGKMGASYANIHYPGVPADVADVTGAGDTFLAALCWGYLHLSNIEEAIKVAIKAASISVRHHGVYTLTKEDIDEITG